MRRDFNDDHTPVGYLITFRTYGTWMHGDKRGSIDRDHRRYGAPVLPVSPRREQIESRLLKQPPVRLNAHQRRAARQAIEETCNKRKWNLWTINVRTNHLHCVVTAHYKAERVRSTFKANATREMRDQGCWRSHLSPWGRGGSAKCLWTEEELANAIAYVDYDQGEPLPDWAFIPLTTFAVL